MNSASLIEPEMNKIRCLVCLFLLSFLSLVWCNSLVCPVHFLLSSSRQVYRICNNARLTNEDGAISSRIIIIISFVLLAGRKGKVDPSYYC